MTLPNHFPPSRLHVHIDALKFRHAVADREIAAAHRRPYACATELRRLKRRRLQLKDQIEQLSREFRHG